MSRLPILVTPFLADGIIVSIQTRRDAKKISPEFPGAEITE